MKSNEVGTTLKHPETINGNVKNLSKRMKMKDKGECHFYFKNLTLPLITTLSCTPKHLTTPTSYLGFRETSPLESPRPGDVGNASPCVPHASLGASRVPVEHIFVNLVVYSCTLCPCFYMKCYPRYLGITRRSCLEAHMVLDMEYREQD
jgi:hypothetical protein